MAGDLERQIESEVVGVLLTDFGVEATYKPAGAEPGVPVLVHVTSTEQAGRKAGIGRYGAESIASRGERLMLMVKALGSDETIVGAAAVGAAGGIRELRVGDAFEVPLRRLGSTAAGTGTLLVSGGIELVSGHWNAEVTR